MRQIDHAHDAKNQGEASSQHEKQQAILNTVQKLDEEVDEIHREKINTNVLACCKLEGGKKAAEKSAALARVGCLAHLAASAWVG